MSINEIMMGLDIGMIYGIVAIGIYITFRIIDFPDLTCDGSFVLGAATSSILIKYGHNPFLVLCIALFAGSIAGTITGILNIYFKIKDLLCGILVAFMLYSINLRVMQGLPNIAIIDEKTIFTDLNSFLILSLLCSTIWLTLSYILKTDFGLALQSTGQNKRLALNSGVSINLMTIIGLSISNALIALGGALFSQHQGFADIGGGIGTIIIGLASVMIGERLLPFRSPFIYFMSCIIGSIIYRMFISFALHSEIFGLETQDLNLITGLLIIGIMLIPRRRIC